MLWRLLLSSSADIYVFGPRYQLPKPSMPSHVIGSTSEGVSWVSSMSAGSPQTFHGIGSSQSPSQAMTVPVICTRTPFVLVQITDRKSTRLNSSHQIISYAVFCLK